MFIVKNAFRNMLRNKGKNILIGIIITVITLCTCIGLGIYAAGKNLISVSKETNPLAVSFNLDMSKLRTATDGQKKDFKSLTIDDVKNFGDSKFVKDYYYTLETSLSSVDIEAANDNQRPQNEDSEETTKMEGMKNRNMGSMGDFRITAYSNFAYLADFSSGTKKITDGNMISNNDNKEIVISQSLAIANELAVGDEVSFHLPESEEDTFSFTIVGIYEDTVDSSSSSFIEMNALNGANQIYASINSVSEILTAMEEDNSKLVATNGLSAEFYLTSNEYVKKFEDEVRSKGLSDYYTLTTNEEEILQELQPVQNISKFSLQFLIVLLSIGIVVLVIISLLNIRDRKYEIGVLRAIGMSKFKVSSQLILEIFFVAMISLIIGTISGSLLAQPVTNQVLAAEISSYTKTIENTQNNFGGDGFEKPSQGMPVPNQNTTGKKGQRSRQVTDYVDSLKVKTSISTILQLAMVTILLTTASGGVACFFVNKYHPNQILQERI